jgi:thiamine-monophosphate kinase
MNRTELSTLGEFGLIAHLTQDFKNKQGSTVKGVGDDAAVIDCGTHYQLVSTDFLVEGVHFDLSYTPLMHLGYKAVAVNVSDICAMNGTARQITVSIAASNRFSVEALSELYAGIYKACERYEVDLVGGDTTSSLSGLVISITVIGTTTKDKIAYRNTAQSGDLICVSGDLGAAFMGLQLLEREKAVFRDNPEIQPDLEGSDYLLERFLKPEARKDVVLQLQQAEIIPTCMIDISDGLASELLHLANQSGVGCRVYQNKIPIDVLTTLRAEEFRMEPVICALNGGEDYELLFGIKAADYEKICKVKGIHIIGHFTDSSAGVKMIGNAENEIEISAQGWNAFTE